MCFLTAMRLLRRSLLLRGWTRLHGVFLPLSGAVHQLLNPRLETPGTVGMKAEFRYVPHPHSLLQLIANESLGCFETGHGVHFGLGNVLDCAVHGHIDR